MHERSAVHLRAINKWLQTEQNFRTGNLLDKECETFLRLETARYEQVFQRITAVILYFAQHNLAFRGSSDTLYTPHNGNFLGLIQLIAKFDSVLNDHLNRTAIKGQHYLSHSIQNELISAMANKVQKVIIDAIRRAKYYSILFDCTPDVSHQEQLSVVLRYVNITDEEVEIKEHFIKFEIVYDTTGKGLSETIMLILDQLGIKISDCRGQGYDNGANMREIYQGVQANILCVNPKAFYVPCGSHNLNLLLGDIAKSSTQALHFFGVLQKIYTIFAASTSRWDVLKKHVEKITPKPLSETRWECRFDSVKAIRFQVRQFRNALIEIGNNASDNKLKIEILSIVRKINEFEFIASLIIWYEILSKINIVSKVLQNQKMQIDLARKHLKGLNVFFAEYRNEGFSKAMIAANEVVKEMDIIPDFKSSYRGKKWKLFDYGQDESSTISDKEYFRVHYFLKIIDTALVSFKSRFELYANHQNIFGFLYMNEIGNLDDEYLLKCCEDLHLHLEGDFDGTEMFEEIKMFRSITQTNYSALDSMNYIVKNNLSEAYPNLLIALQIMLTTPVTVASAERSFSRLKLIKNYLRSSISQERFSSLAILSIESEVANSIDFDDVIKDLSSKKARKII
ncbi:PREDICTED: zinc finger MYM-type protein 1-like [Dufourea novaeangliae]|uniref:zinc finger MYM-type protein 1-like n=1 Tax=Dufourea novaeangliae TaxID=178035 RepID=UPI000767A16E|nr:PREDICTED: zinc finger MYM-type protein 1-like [Dufourea novaeangliae]